MRPGDIRQFHERRPFEPFRITLTDGRVYEVGHPELALVGHSTVTIGLRRSGDSGGDFDRLVTVSLLHIMEMEVRQPDGAP